MLRIYEITGNPSFLQNFKNVIKLIESEFFKNDDIYNLFLKNNEENIFLKKRLLHGTKERSLLYVHLWRFIEEAIFS